MSTLLKLRRGLLVLACAAPLLALPAPAAGATKAAGLRVVEPSRGALAEHTQYTGTARIKTDPKAECFGPGTGGSTDKVKVPGATALGLVHDAGRVDRDLRPLSVTDSFGFGLGVCGIGGFDAPATGYWYVKQNNAGAEVGGDQLKLGRGDEVLWYLVTDFNDPLPAELELKVAPRTRPGPVEVTVHEYADDGTRSLAEGARIEVRGSAAARASGAPIVTDAEGKATVTTADRGRLVLGASRRGDIPAAEVRVCVHERLGECTDAHGKRVRGSDRGDDVRGTPGDDVIRPHDGKDSIKARAGDDTVKAKGGGRDRINCGAGDDTATVGKGDRVRNCETVKRS